MTKFRLTSGFEDFGFGDTPEAAIKDAEKDHPREWLDEQIRIGSASDAMGSGLCIEEDADLPDDELLVLARQCMADIGLKGEPVIGEWRD